MPTSPTEKPHPRDRTLCDDSDLGERGFSLAEMLLVVALLALASGLVMARGGGAGSGAAEAQLVRYLREARAEAMVAGGVVRIVLDPVTQSLSGAATHAPDPGGPMQLDAPGGAILFHPDGSSRGGTLRVTPARGPAFGVAVQPLSGAVAALR